MIKSPEELLSLDVVDNYPGWERAPDFLRNWVLQEGPRQVADLGGGANPMLDRNFIQTHAIDYSLIDISRAELDKAPDYYSKVQADIMSPPEEFARLVGRDRYDLVFSHMFLEHVPNPAAAHLNIWNALKPGGCAIHFFPSHWNFPLAVNRFFPEFLTRGLVRVFQPNRDIDGMEGKFPAYYVECGAPTKKKLASLESIGYQVDQYSGFIGHGYYESVPLVRDLEKYSRPMLLRLRIPLTSCILLILRKPLAATR